MPRGRKSPYVVELSEADRETLEKWQRSTTISAGLARRGRIILLVAEGKSFTQTARLVGVQRCVVRQWVKRFLAHGIAGLYDQPRPGRKPLFPLGSKLTRRETCL